MIVITNINMNGAFPGQEVELPDDEAKSLLRQGYVRPLPEEVVEATPEEVVDATPEEVEEVPARATRKRKQREPETGTDEAETAIEEPSEEEAQTTTTFEEE